MMERVTEGERALLWVGSRDQPVADRALVETAARTFDLTVRFCVPAEVSTVMRAGQFELVGIELGDQPERSLKLLKDLHERLPHVTLFAALADSSVPVIRAALEAGASDFLSLPLNSQELHKAFIKLTQLSTRAAPRQAVNGEVITIYGARGGLGATTLAVNLAVRLTALTKRRVALADFDLQRGDVAAFLNLTPLQSLATIAAAPGEIDELFLHHTLTRHVSGIFVLPAPAQILEADSISHDKVDMALRLLRAQFNYTVVDTARTLTDAALPAFEQAERILLLADLSVPGVRAARRVLELLVRVGIPSDHVDLLVTEAVPGPVKLEDAVHAIGKSPLLVIPRDDASASQAMNAGAPLNGYRPSSLTTAISQLAAKLAGVPAEGTEGRGRGLGRLFGRGRRQGA